VAVWRSFEPVDNTLVLRTLALFISDWLLRIAASLPLCESMTSCHTRVNESCEIYEWVMSHTNINSASARYIPSPGKWDQNSRPSHLMNNGTNMGQIWDSKQPSFWFDPKKWDSNQSSHQNTNQNPVKSSQVSFQTSHPKKNFNFEHSFFPCWIPITISSLFFPGRGCPKHTFKELL